MRNNKTRKLSISGEKKRIKDYRNEMEYNVWGYIELVIFTLVYYVYKSFPSIYIYICPNFSWV